MGYQSSETASIYPIHIGSRLYPFEYDRHWGYINETGSIIVPPKFEEARFFYSGLANVKLHGKWGYMNETGAIVIPAEYSKANPFSELGAWVSKDGVEMLIDKKGKVLKTIVRDYKTIGLKDELMKIKSKQKYGYINVQGDIIIEPEFTEAGRYSNGLAWVVTSAGDHQYIDAAGNVVISLPANYVGNSFSEGLASFVDHDTLKTGYIDMKGNVVIAPRLSSGDFFSEGLAVATTRWGKKGYINQKGEFHIGMNYDKAHPFIRGTALIGDDSNFWFIDHEGNPICNPLQFDYIDMQSYILDSDLISVMVNGESCFIKRGTGALVTVR